MEVEEFTALVRRHEAMVFSIAYHFLHDRAAAEEVAQEVFLQLHRKLPALESADHVKSWLRRVTGHRCVDYVRRNAPAFGPSLEEIDEPQSSEARGDVLLESALRKLVASLPEKLRLVIILRYQEDMDPAEIAEGLEMPAATVKSNLQRGLQMLREKAARALGGVSV